MCASLTAEYHLHWPQDDTHVCVCWALEQQLRAQRCSCSALLQRPRAARRRSTCAPRDPRWWAATTTWCAKPFRPTTIAPVCMEACVQACVLQACMRACMHRREVDETLGYMRVRGRGICIAIRTRSCQVEELTPRRVHTKT
jgi:hypothetical protein